MNEDEETGLDSEASPLVPLILRRVIFWGLTLVLELFVTDGSDCLH